MPVVGQALSITGFVLVMMLVIEYVHVFTGGASQERLARGRAGQYLLAALMGAIPGCLGAFLVVGMYTHGLLGLGALVTAMIATSGDEAFVMFAMIPGPALVVTASLLVVGVATGALVDLVSGHRRTRCVGLELHQEEHCRCLSHGEVLQQLRAMTPVRGVLLLGLGVFLAAITTGHVGPASWNWLRWTAVTLSVVALFIVATVPEHFLEEHLWNHVVRQHLGPLFGWTLGALVVMQLITRQVGLTELMREQPWVILLIAGVVGLIPESGPHLVFVTLFAQGELPLAVLLTSSIVQDGHGMLPLLAHSRSTFAVVKLVNLAVGVVVGALVLGLGP